MLACMVSRDAPRPARQALYPAIEDMGILLDLLKETANMFNLRVSPDGLMPARYARLVQTPDANPARGKRHRNGACTPRHNARNKCDGTLFRGRYQSLLKSNGDLTPDL